MAAPILAARCLPLSVQSRRGPRFSTSVVSRPVLARQWFRRQQELDRVVPLVEALAPLNIPLSIDTVKPAVMRESIRAGADLINDIASFRAPGALEAVCGQLRGVERHAHAGWSPGTMQLAPSYRDVVAEVRSFLDERVRVLLDNGVSRQRIVVDPGFGFGKTLDHNLALLRHLEVFGESGFPVFEGMSRKTMLGAITGREV